MDVFQDLPSNSVPLCLISWENKNKSAKIVDLHKSGSSWGAISKCLKVPRSSVQTKVCEYRRCVLSPIDERTLVAKSENQSQNNSKGPCEDAGENRVKSIYIHSKKDPIST